MSTKRGAILTVVALATTAAGAVVFFGLAKLRSDAGTIEHAPPAPEFASFDSASRLQILSYARSLSYAEFHGSSDTRRLSPSCRGCKTGPIATIQAQAGIHLMSSEDLGKGRIIGREINEDTVSIRGLGAHDTSYVWVDSTETGWRAVVVPSRLDLPMVESPMVYKRHPDLRWRQPLARWVWTPDVGVSTDESEWWGCPTGCCTKQ